MWKKVAMKCICWKQIEMSLLRLMIIGITALLTLASCTIESMSQNDFRYMSYQDLLSTASRYYDQNVTTYSHFHFDESKSLMFVGARDRIYRFSLQLDLMQTVKWEVPSGAIDTCLAKGQTENDCRNYIMSIHTFNSKLFVCGTFAYSPSCSWRKQDTLELIKEEKGLSAFNPRSNVTSLVMNDGNMFIGSTIDFSGSDSVIARIPLRTDLSMDSSKILRTKQYNNLELFNAQFVGSFEHGEFVYFIFREESIEMASFGEKAIYSRIGRVCKSDSGGFHIYKENWSSFLKARLNCSLSGGETPFYFNEVQDITFMSDENELYATFSTPDYSIQGSAICVFSMNAIKRAFEGPVKFQAAPNSPVWQQKVIENRDQFECKSSLKSSSTLLDASKFQLMAKSVIPITHDPLYVEKLEKFVRIAVTKVATKLHENVKIIFAANNDGFIKKISILPRTKESCLIEVLEPEYKGIKVETMRFIKSTESLFVGTRESIMKIPSQHCSRHLSKVSCINSMDPYCGWNDLSEMCGMAPNGNSLTDYWYQNATTCPILSSPVDGAWSSWTAWFKCAKSNPSGSYSEADLNNIDSCLCRTRTCDNPAPKFGGKHCEGHSIMVTNCTEHGGWSDWSSYGPCSQTCGVAIKVRRRTCSNPAPKHNGRLCIGNNQQEIYCTDLPPCPTTNINMQIDGGWSEWNEWSTCSAPCGGGFRIRERKCNNPVPQNDGLDCIGCNVEYEECNKQACNEVKKLTSWTNWLVSNNSENGQYFEKRYRYMCKAPISDPANLKISLYKEETRACSIGDPKCRRVNVTCEATVCDPPKDCSEFKEEARKCNEIIQSEKLNVTKAGLEFHWIGIITILFGLFCIIFTFFLTKYFVERRILRLRAIQGSPHYLSSYPNQYSSLPTKDYSENNKPKRQPSFSGTSTTGRLKVTNGTLNKSNNNLLNQNTPKILKYQNDTEMSTLKRNSALNNMRLKQIEDDKDKY